MEAAARQRLTEQLARLADGDREAFHPVFVALAPVLRRFARRYLADAEAEDVAQEALLKVFARAYQFDRARDGLSWALGIAVWEVRTVRRRRFRRRELPLDEPVAESRSDPAPSPEQTAIASVSDEALDQVLRTLPDRDRQALLAYARGERTSGVEPATFRKRVERALGRLRRAMAVDGRNDAGR